MKTIRLLIFSMIMLLLWHSQARANIVISEFLADPANGIAGDANRDGVRNSIQDEFVELFNPGSETKDLSLWSLWDLTELRHKFSPGVLLPSNEFLTVFGGGTPSNILGLVFVSTQGNLSLNNTSDKIFLKNALGVIEDSVTYGSQANQDQSLSRLADGTGPWMLHSKISTQGYLFSPGSGPNGERPETKTTEVPEPSTFGLVFGALLFSTRRFLGKQKSF